MLHAINWVCFMGQGKDKFYREQFIAYGHQNITSIHQTTLEVTTHPNLSSQGDCIIAVRSSKSARTLNARIKSALKHPKAKVRLEIKCEGEKDSLTGNGNPDLVLTHPHDLVCRKSSFIDDRTLIVNATKAANELNPSLIEKIKKPGNLIEFELQIEIPS